MLTTIWKTQAISTRLQALISGFLANARGNVAVITALSALPIISAIGCVVDCGDARRRLGQLAADRNRQRP
jgi:Flp pilus assembly protein TadG